MEHEEFTPDPRTDGPESRPPATLPDSPTPARSEESSNERDHLQAVVRTLLRAEEKHRLYPDGHQQVRRALKEVLSAMQAFSSEVGRSFAFVTEYALGLLEAERTSRARDMAALAYPCRIRRIARITVHPDADVESLEALVRLLHLPRDDEDPEASSAELARSLGDRIEVAFAGEGVEEESYLFDVEGRQLFGGNLLANAAGVSADLPLPLRRSLAHVFSNPEIVQRLDELRDRLAGRGTAQESGAVDLVSQIIRSVFDDPATLIDTPEETITARVLDFLRVLDGLGDAIPVAREGATTPLPADAESILRKAIGLGLGAPTGLAGTLRDSAPLRATIERPPEAPVPRSAATNGAVPSLADVDTLFPEVAAKASSAPAPAPHSAVPPPLPADATAAGPEPRIHRIPSRDGVEPHPLKIASRPAPRSEPAPRSPARELDDFASLRAIAVDPARVARSIAEHPWALETLRVREEILVLDPPADAGDPRLERLVAALSTHPWDESTSFAAELERIEDLLDAGGVGGAIVCRSLASQPAQEHVEAWFRRRAEAGAEVETMRAPLAAVATADPRRSISALVSLWRKSGRPRRNEWIDEVFRLHPDPEQIAFWAKRCPQGFASSHAQKWLGNLPADRLRGICERILDDQDARGIVESPSILTCVRSIAKSADAEEWLARMISRSSPNLKRDIIALLDGCTNRELFVVLSGELERENSASEPDIELVHLVLATLRRSVLPHARNFLRRIRTERRRLLYTYRREIREILALLDKVEEAGQ